MIKRYSTDSTNRKYLTSNLLAVFSPFTGIFAKLVLSFLFLLAFSANLSSQGCLNTGDTYNSPCTSCLYDFGGDAGNIVPCGPSANTTSSVPIDHGNGSDGYTPPSGCGTLPTGNDVLWVSFIINTGGSFEWQTVPGADKFNWIMYYSTGQPPNTGSNVSADCDNLVFYKCGEQFTGWEIETTPDPTKMWRYYIAFFLNGNDKDNTGDGVVKIRKSCGLACADPATATPTATEICIETASVPTAVTLDAVTTGASYLWSATPADPTLGDVLGEEQTQMPVVSPTVTTTYFVSIIGTDGCPLATGEVLVEVKDNCTPCLADAGTISGANETVCEGSSSSAFSATTTAGSPDYSYALFLVDASGNIIISSVTAGTSTSFSSTGLSGMYFVYGLSYQNSQAATDAADYVDNFGTLAALQADISPTGTTSCAELTDDTPFKLTIADPNCGSFPQN